MRKAQVYLLIAGSLVFYGTGQIHLLPLLVFTAITAGVLAWISRTHARSKAITALGVVIFLSVLAFFKYKFLPIFDVVNRAQNLDGALQFMLLLPLPIGISFYTFQAISLIVDESKQKYDSDLNREKSAFAFIKNCFFYIIFFPQLVAGPIVKAHNFLPQIKPKYLKDVNVEFVAKTLIAGIFFKSVIADNLNVFTLNMGRMVETGDGTGMDALVLLFAYSFQIYADFFGYTLMAIAVAALYGYKLPENFNVPYIAQSISEFWRRWHISLSSFLREYLYYPLGGNRKGNSRTYINLIIVMGLGGLWHGAAMSYMFWGLFHGFGLAIERPFMKTRFYTSQHPVMVGVRTLFIFLFVSFAWIFFKFPNYDHVQTYLGFFSQATEGASSVLSISDLYVIGLLCLPVIVQHTVVKFNMVFRPVVEVLVYGGMLFLCTVQGGAADAFIYFQF